MGWVFVILLGVIFIGGNRLGSKRARRIQDVRQGINFAYYMIVFNLTVVGVAIILATVH